MVPFGGRGPGRAATLLAVLVLVGTVAPVAAPTTGQTAMQTTSERSTLAKSAGPATATSRPADGPPSVSVRVERVPASRSQVRLHLTFDAADFERPFWVIDYTDHVTSAEGFLEAETGNGDPAYRWDRETTTPSLTVVTDANVAAGGTFDGKEFATTEAWAFVPTPRLSVAWLPEGNGGWRYRSPFADGYARPVTFDTSGVLGRSFLYVGEHETYAQMANGQRFRVVVAANATPKTRPADALDALAAAGEHLSGEPSGDVTAFVLPDPIRRGGFAASANGEFWVHETARLSNPSNVWVHEYVHTRQRFHLGDRMKWFREASAVYFAADAGVRRNGVSKTAVARSMTRKQFEETVLSNRATWGGAKVPYYAGAVVTWALDRKIRNVTGGERGLLDVFARMNDHEGRVTYADFQRIVADVAGRSLDAWLDRYVTTTARPAFAAEANAATDGSAAGASDAESVDESSAGEKISIRRPLAVAADRSSMAVFWGGLALVGVASLFVVGRYVSGAWSRE